jgi:hypothetical protein
LLNGRHTTETQYCPVRTFGQSPSTPCCGSIECALACLKRDVQATFEAHRSEIDERALPPSASRVWIKELTPELLCVAELGSNPGVAELRACVGFPFPIATSTVLQPDPISVRLSLHLHGPYVTRVLHQRLREALIADGITVDWVVQPDAATMHAATLSAVSAPADAIIYLDQFRFIGDSVSHLANIAVWNDLLPRAPLYRLTTNSSLCGSVGFGVLTPQEFLNELSLTGATDVLLLLPVFIDDQWDGAVACILQALKLFPSVRALVLGRHILCVGAAESHVRVVHAPQPDLVLYDLPVEVTREQARIVMVGSHPRVSPSSTRQGIGRRRALISPFASLPEKTLRSDHVASLVNLIKTHDLADDIILIGGSPFSVSDNARLDSYSRGIHDVACVTPTFDQLDDILQDAAFLVAADSSHAHFALRHQIPTVVTYNERNWWPKALSSLLHHSPLGFASRSSSQVPIVLSWSEMDSGDVSEYRHLLEFIPIWLRLREPSPVLEKLLRRLLYRVEHENDAFRSWRAFLTEARSTTSQSPWLWEWYDPTNFEPALISRQLSDERFKALCFHAVAISAPYKLAVMLAKGLQRWPSLPV